MSVTNERLKEYQSDLNDGLYAWYRSCAMERKVIKFKKGKSFIYYNCEYGNFRSLKPMINAIDKVLNK